MTPGRGGAARRHPRGPEPLRPGRAPEDRRRRAATSCCALLLQQGYLDARPVPRRARRRRCPNPQERARCPRRRARPRRTSRTTSRTSSCTQYGARGVFGGGLRVTTTLDVGLQQLAPRRDREGAARRTVGPTAALVALDAHTGAVLAMVGGAQLPREPVQPRDAGRAAAGLVVQAVRARDRAPERDRAVDDVRRRSR